MIGLKKEVSLGSLKEDSKRLEEIFRQLKLKEKTFQVGSQRYIHIQDKKNKRRRQRSRKKTPEPVLPAIERVFAIFKTGRLIDRVHYKEVDPYWGTLWRQYELIRYLEVYLRKVAVELAEREDIEERALKELLVKIKNIEEGRKEIVHYLCNAFYIQMGGVINTRYYGWEELYPKFLSSFQETGVELVKKLQYDPDKTRCSVYFYQAFWLVGLQVIEEADKEDVEVPISADPNRGRRIFSEDFDDGDIDNMDFISSIVEGSAIFDDSSLGEDLSLEEIVEEGIEVPSSSQGDSESVQGTDDSLIEDTAIIEETQEDMLSGKLTFLDQYLKENRGLTVQDLRNIRAELTQSQELELTAETVEIVRRLLTELDLSPDLLYLGDRFISKFKKELKKAIREGRVKLSEKEKLVLSLYLGKPIFV